MSDKKLLAEDFVLGLLASEPVDEVARIIARAKKGMDTRYKNRVDTSWKPTELKKLRGRLLFSQWSWFDHGFMARQSWDGTITQDVHCFYTDSIQLSGSPKSKRAYSMLERLANNAVANCDGGADIKVILTDDQIRIFFAEEGGTNGKN
ncbi:hypothetical protein KAU19_02225 [Candidatus Parcubacteria bacterium]|nr:hypothetical protein [Candidatus Parcubacteria bacterium]